MKRPKIILDPHWRQMSELFSDDDRKTLSSRYDVVWARDAPAPPEVIRDALHDCAALISCTPSVSQDVLNMAPDLKAVIEVSGSLPSSIDYAGCAARGVEVLSCAPGFKQSVAEMTLAMMLSGARGLVDEHERFRAGDEHWLADNDATDFTLFGQRVGFVGYGSIAREVHRLLKPFSPTVLAHDPWMEADAALASNITLASLATVMQHSRCVVVAASPTVENEGLIGQEMIGLMPRGALLIVISRAHLVDFDAVLDAADAGHIRAAIDVFPEEPLSPMSRARSIRNVILSPHRAAAVPGGRQLIGNMILHDLKNILSGNPDRQLSAARADQVDLLAGVGDAESVAAMAERR